MPCLQRKLPSNKYYHFFIVAAAWALCTSFAASLAQAQPAGAIVPNVTAKVPPADPSTSAEDDRLGPWAKIIRHMDSEKLERLRICMQAQGAQTNVFQAINICVPCISSEAAGAPDLTAAERQCLKQQPGRNDSSSGGQTVPGHNPVPSVVNPQCSGTKMVRGPNETGVSHRTRVRRWTRARQARARWLRALARYRAAEFRVWRFRFRREASRSDRATMREVARLTRLLAAAERAKAKVQQAFNVLVTNGWAEPADYEAMPGNEVMPGNARKDPAVETPDDLPGAGVEDPRCLGKRTAAGWGAPWQDMCRSDDGHIDPMKCARRLTTIIGAVTNGHCWAEPGKDDAPTVVCKDENGQPVASGVDPNGQPTTPGATNVNDPTPWNKPKPGKGTAGPFIPNSPIGGFMEELCTKGRCPDPLPTLGKITTAPNGSMRESRSMPPADQECLNGVNKSKKACRVSRKPRDLPSVDATELEPRWKKKLRVKKRWNEKRRTRTRRRFDVPDIAKHRFRRHRFTNHRMMQRRALQFRRSTFSRRRQFRAFRSRRSSFSRRANTRFNFAR